MKFTEEQYQKIADLQEKDYKFSILEENGGGCGFWRALINIEPDIARFVHESKLIDELAAIANPLTREWAHEQFVEKEKKYLWTTPLVAGIKYALIKENGKYVLSDMYLTGKGTPLTELEVVNIGLKTDWFIKEEAE